MLIIGCDFHPRWHRLATSTEVEINEVAELDLLSSATQVGLGYCEPPLAIGAVRCELSEATFICVAT